MGRPSQSSLSASSAAGAAVASDHVAAKQRALAAVSTARQAATLLALLMGLTVLGVSASTLSVYDRTKVPAAAADVLPGLWPAAFTVRPTVSLVVGSTLVVLAGAAGLVGARVRALRTPTSLAAPVVGLVAALVAVGLFYAANADEGMDTFTSWTCRWKAVPMTVQPRWDTLCKQSWTGVYLAVLLVPVEAAALGLAVWERKGEREVAELRAKQGGK